MRLGAGGTPVPTDWDPRIRAHGLGSVGVGGPSLGGEGLFDFFEQLGCFEELEEERVQALL